MKTISQLAFEATEFASSLKSAKMRVSEPGLSWYPYDSVSNLATFASFLTGKNRDLFERLPNQRVLDIGCADGDLAFFFECQGFQVDAVDHPIPNFNAMRGVRSLKASLNSAIALHSIDLDSAEPLPEAHFGLALVLGLVYHLKNPFHLLERLSKIASYALVSSAITEFVPGLDLSVDEAPVAYLADAWELNGDSTNYWICSDAGFRRLLARANWTICEYAIVRGGEARIAGRRAFCLCRSVFESQPVRVLYGCGWHAEEPGGWRWTEGNFSVRFESSRPLTTLRLSVYVARSSAVTLRAFANGIELEPATFTETGPAHFDRDLMAVHACTGDIRIDFHLDSAIPPDASDPRERGIIVASIGAD